ncbi:hypothetical protein [Bacillus infantis]|uniref:hypothetical protein n=1 Tax=Bacillus infantis TaxID=324767 RepID=UPI003CEAC91C
MKKIVRYVIRMRNGSYMRQVLDDTKVGVVLVKTVDHPIDSDLYKERKTPERLISDLINGARTFLPVVWDKDNPPEEVEELKINL